MFSFFQAVDGIRVGHVTGVQTCALPISELGMQTFDQALYDLYDSGEITYEDALAHADSPNDLRLMIKLGSETDVAYLSNAADELSIQEDGSDDKGRLF